MTPRFDRQSDASAAVPSAPPRLGASQDDAGGDEDFSELQRVRAPEPRLAGVHVLVVEDEPDAREIVGALLESRGAKVVLTASAAEAYSSLDHELPDIILSDIGMPDEDGYQFARRVRTFSPERGGKTPIVALTAYASPQDRRRTREAGYSYHLVKPVDAEQLVNVLEMLSKARLS
ncbi:MAG TPA: response regulator [Polyangiaceae bacterium]|nr:response regulator [Polyangiaceae bacterium]